jgi:hypothetical protein
VLVQKLGAEGLRVAKVQFEDMSQLDGGLEMKRAALGREVAFRHLTEVADLESWANAPAGVRSRSAARGIPLKRRIVIVMVLPDGM